MAEVVVGIDFGSSGSGFAYAFQDNPKEIINGYIYGTNADNKVPTEIILDDDNITLAFGAQCKEYIKTNNLEKVHYFKKIKMNLYAHKTDIKAQNSEKILSLELVIQRVLENLRDLAIVDIRKKRPNINNDEIKWVVTVPAIWKEFQKTIMMDACIKANLIKEEDDKSLFFALEPEAASYYCIENKSLDQNLMKEGDCYIICDLGGGTGDIVAHLIKLNNSLTELCPPNGGKLGSNEINRLFLEETINKLFDCKDFNTYYQKYKEINEGDENENEEDLFNEWSELEREINDFKESTDLEKVKDYYKIKLEIFKDIFNDKSINDLVDDYNSDFDDNELKLQIKSENRWIIKFPYKIIYNFIKEQVNSICEIIKNIINSSDENINSIIFVGGYSNNKILISEIKKQILNIEFLQPPKPCLAVIEGAVLFGLDSNKIVQRKAKYTFGIKSDAIWKKKLHSIKSEKKYYDEYDKKFYCKDCFSILFKINQNLQLGQEIVKEYTMLYPRYSELVFYITPKPNPIFIDEDEIEKIGEMAFDAGKEYPQGERRCIITIRIGGTFYDIKVKHIKSGKILRTKFKFS